jgi:hypothetical protein
MSDEMIESILLTIKKLLGIEEEYTQFDSDIIVHINSAFSVLHQLGIGPVEAVTIESDANEWSEFFESRSDINLVKTYIYLKVRLVFDPPQTGYVLDAFNKQVSELEWRLNAVEVT